MTDESTVNTIYPVIEEAVDILTTEIEILAAEQEALRAFRGRISDIPADDFCGPVPQSGAPPRNMRTKLTPSDNLQAIRTAYRETVMAVPHYDSVYGESFEEHVTAEFNQTVANNLIHGETLTEPLYSTLVETTKQLDASRGAFRTEL